MRILVFAVIIGLPLMALGQTAEPQQTQAQQQQGQTNETQTTAPTKGKKAHAVQEQDKTQVNPDTSTSVHEKTKVEGSTDVNRTGAEKHSSTSHTTTVNKQEFRTRHTEVFSLGRHPKAFFVQKFGERHFRLIGHTYFVFVDGCWVAVDVDGFTYTERVICQGEPEFIVID